MNVSADLDAGSLADHLSGYSGLLQLAGPQTFWNVVAALVCGVAIYLYLQNKDVASVPAKGRAIEENEEDLKKAAKPGFYGDNEVTKLDFSQVTPYKPDFDLSSEDPIEWWRNDYIRDRTYTVTMAIQNLPFNEWILMDKNYKQRMDHKKNVLETAEFSHECRPAAYEASIELLELLVEYLPRRFPTVFSLSSDGGIIYNKATGESYQTRGPFEKIEQPLLICSRLIEDDIAMLVKGPSGEYVLQAVIAAFPAGFDVKAKMGLELTDIHGPVPMYKERLQRPMNKFFSLISPTKMVYRTNWGINDKLEFVLEHGHLYDGDEGKVDAGIDINQVQLRVERQVLRRLPRTRALSFLTKTYFYPVAEIAKAPGFAARLGGMLHKLPEKFAFYKRKPVWGKVVLDFLDEMAERYPGPSDGI